MKHADKNRDPEAARKRAKNDALAVTGADRASRPESVSEEAARLGRAYRAGRDRGDA